MLGISETAILILLSVGMLIFGHDKIPEFARSLGKAREEFQKGLGNNSEEEENE